MKVEITDFGKYKVLKVLEKFDIVMDYDEFKRLFKDFLANGNKFVAVDFANVEYINSSIISVLIHFYKEVKEADGDICIIAKSQSILNTLEELNLKDILHIYPTLDGISK
jgi:anti-anti-sigma factor